MSKRALLAEQVLRLLIAAGTLAFLLSGCFYLYDGRWTETRLDFWRIYDVCLNQPGLRSALIKVNNHSLFFPSLIWLADIRFFHNNQEVLFHVGMILLCSTVALLLVFVWRDVTLNITTKLSATLVVVVANFWMVRSSITASGGFNCICSLAIGGAILAIYYLQRSKERPWLSIAVVASGFVASFSFGAGLALWPALFVLAWSLRLPHRTLWLVLISGVAAAIIYKILPGAEPSIRSKDAISIASGLYRLSRLLGAPFLYATAAWRTQYLSAQAAELSGIPFAFGILGLGLSVIAIASAVIRRNVGRSQVQIIALGLIIFSIMAMVFAVLGRTEQMRVVPTEVLAPRYTFWTTLFWAGLLLSVLAQAEKVRWLRYPTAIVCLAAPVYVFPEHYREAINSRNARFLAESAATGLINGVRDAQAVKALSGIPSQVYHLVPQYRARYLDMFADRLQNWIGRPETILKDGRYQATGLRGILAANSITECDNGAPAARFAGWAVEERSIPRYLVIINSNGVVCGVARATTAYPNLNRQLKLNRFAVLGFVGYIRDYDKNAVYVARSIDGALSKEEIVVKPLTSPR